MLLSFTVTRWISSRATLAKVHMTIRPGGFDDPAQGWTGGYATRGTTGAVYLNVEYTVLEGPFARRKVFSMIGLHSPKGPEWANMGRGFIRSILNSSRGLSDKHDTPEAQAARRISGFADLDGIEFVAKIDVGTDSNGDEKNDIRTAVTPDHREYAALMGSAHHQGAATYAAPPQSAPATGGRPAWAQ